MGFRGNSNQTDKQYTLGSSSILVPKTKFAQFRNVVARNRPYQQQIIRAMLTRTIDSKEYYTAVCKNEQLIKLKAMLSSITNSKLRSESTYIDSVIYTRVQQITYLSVWCCIHAFRKKLWCLPSQDLTAVPLHASAKHMDRQIVEGNKKSINK